MLVLDDCFIDANIRDTASLRHLVVFRNVHKGELDFLMCFRKQILHVGMPSTWHRAVCLCYGKYS